MLALVVRSSHPHNQRVELVVVLGQFATFHGAHARDRMLRVFSDLWHGESRRLGVADRAFYQRADFLIGRLFIDQAMAF